MFNRRFRFFFPARRQALIAAAILLFTAPVSNSGELPLREGHEAITVPWEGALGVTETTADIMARAEGYVRPPKLKFRTPKNRPRGRTNFESLLADTASPPRAGESESDPVAASDATTALSFTGATLFDTQAFPPDSMGAVGPAQFIVAVNGRIRSFNKTNGVADGVLNANPDVFFSSVMTPPVEDNFTSDPRIRYDRLSRRWFVIIIDVPGQAGALPNRIMIAVSDGSVITPSTVWTFYQFQHDLVTPTSNSDTGNFADYPTLGVDTNALYIGVNVFQTSGQGSFENTTAFVVRKSSLLSGGPIVVSAFRALISNSPQQGGPYTPQGVDNFDPNTTEGYFIGVDSSFYGRMKLRRVSDPGGAPSISGNINITIPLNGNTINVPHLGNTNGTSGYLDGLDYRLMAAHIRNGRLWTAANIAVDNTGVPNGTDTRMGVRWYELDGIATGQTPSVVQSGTVFEQSASNSTTNRHHWMGSVMVSGQGHALMGFSTAGVNEFANAAYAYRLASDPANSFRAPVLYTASSSAYNPPSNPGGAAGRRWGDYSYACVDPDDDMTMWTIQEWTSAPNIYAVQVAKVLAPSPAIPSNCSPASVIDGVTTNITLTGLSDGDTGFFDPGSGFSNRIAAAVGGAGVTVNSVTYSNSTNVTLNISVAVGATAGTRTVTVTNPDGQSATSSSGILTIVPSGSTNIAPVLAAIANKTDTETLTLTFTNSATDTNGDTLTFSLDAGAPTNAAIDSATGVFTWTPTESQGPGTSNITVRVTDNGTPPFSDAKTFSVTVLESNLPPTLNAISNRTVVELTALTFTNPASDPDLPANTLTFSFVSGAPTNATLNSSNGVFTWTPSEAQGSGTSNITIRVVDNGSPIMSATQSFTVTVLDTNSAPVLTAISNRTIFELATLTFTNTASDSDLPANALTFSFASAAPPNATLNSSNGVFSWTPTEAQGPGTNTISVKVADDGSPSMSATQTFTLTVLETNSTPTLAAISNYTIGELTTLTFTNDASDSDIPTNTLTFSFVSGAPTNATLNSSNGVFTWTPNEAQGPSTNPISIRVTDNGSPIMSATQSFTVFVLETNSPPSLSPISDRAIFEQQTLLITNAASDPDIPANALTFSLDTNTAPAGAAINATNGVFSWTPDELQGSTTNLITVVVTDNGSPSLSDTQSFTITVLETNSAPTLNPISDKTIVEGQTLTVTNSASDSDIPADTLTFSLDTNTVPAGAEINPTNGVFTWTPTEPQGPSTNPITVIVADDGTPSMSATQTFTVFVLETNSAPILTGITDQILDEGATLTITNSATDLDLPPNVLTYSLDSGSPTNAVINSTNGVLTWTPTETQGPGTNNITVRVTDNGSPMLSDTKTFSVVVNEINEPPVLAMIADMTVSEGATLMFTNVVSDADVPANTFTFSFDSTPPVGANLDTNNGVFSWTPTEAQGGTTNVISIRVTDFNPSAVNTQHLGDAKSFTVFVSKSNSPPMLAAIADRTIHAGTTLVVTNSAMDSDVPANTLTFSLDAGAPAGAKINPTNGILTWLTDGSFVNTTNPITVRATDDGAPPLSDVKSFSVTVVPPPVIQAITISNDVVTITWSAIAGQKYAVQHNEDLNSTNWSDLSPDVTASGATASKDDSIISSTQRYYRILVR